MKALSKEQIEDLMQTEDVKSFYGERRMHKIMRPIECPICYQQVKVYLKPNAEKVDEMATEVVRTSSLDHCPRCKCGRLD